jgi:hypothetical protein
MKIAIYGDSFAQPVEFGYKGNDFLWCNSLANKLNGSINNFATTGSSIFYSYQKFLRTYNEYDLCIFAVTSPNRYIKPLKISYGPSRHIASIDQLNFYRKKLKLNAEDIQLFNWLEGWFLSSDSNYNKCMSNLMMNDILNKKSNTIIYPCFKESSLDENIISFNQMHKIQLAKMGKDVNDVNDEQNFLHNENYHKIAGHFTESFNNFISEMMYNKIKHGIDYDFSKLQEIEIDPTIDYYDFIDKRKDCPK